MPIKPENKALYPSNWKTEIRPAILARAGDCCEFCGVADHAIGARDVDGVWHLEEDIYQMSDDVRFTIFSERAGMVKIVLTIAHLDHNPANNDHANLRALCQRCHNRYDQAHRQANAAATRKAKRITKAAQAQPLQEIML